MLKEDPSQIQLWAETEAELNDFLDNLSGGALRFGIALASVGKRGTKRPVGDSYLQGVFYVYDLQNRVVKHEKVTAPNQLIDLVQWQCPDLIFTRNDMVLLSVETTTHVLAYDNVAQRILRPIRATLFGVPSIIFQKYDANDKTYVSWFAEAFRRNSIINKTPSCAILFTDDSYEEARKDLIEMVNARVFEEDTFETMCNRYIKENSSRFPFNERLFSSGARGHGRNWLRIDRDKVTVVVGAKPNAKTWHSKGTGSMDPYPGLVKMAELLSCYDSDCNRIRASVETHFRYLPRDFWWFVKYPNELYYKIIKEISNNVTYAGERTFA